jgi:dynactin 1
MSEELKDLLREVKIRVLQLTRPRYCAGADEQDQTLQESGVKVEILERRLEATRKQADQIIELENDLTKAKKQEKVYSDAIEQLQAEQDALEGENARLRKGVDPARESLLPAVELALPMGGGLESSQLAEQVCYSLCHDVFRADPQVENLRSAIRYLRSENSLLKSRHLYPDLKLLAPIPSLPTIVPKQEAEEELPGLSPTNSSNSDTSPPSTPITPTRLSLEKESKILIRDITNFQLKPRIVDISNISSTKGWKSRKGSPEAQVGGWKKEEEKLGRRVEGLKERMRGLKVR